MNITLSFFTLSHLISHSPTLTANPSSRILSCRIFHSQFRKSFSPIFFSTSPLNFEAQNSLFQQFILTPLRFERAQYSDATIDARRLSFIVGSVNISYCRFRLCLGRNGISGGAIFCVANLSLTQCLFEHNSARKAGSIYCNGELLLKSVTFDGGYSDIGQGFINEDCDYLNLHQELVTFVNLEAINSACFIRSSPGNVVINAINLSTSSAKNSNAGFSLFDTKNDIIFSIFFELTAFKESCIFMKRCKNTQIDRTLYWLIRSSNDNTEGSTCLSYYDTSSKCTVLHCAFLLCSPGGSQLVKASDFAQIFISEACTTVDRVSFIGDESGISVDKKLRVNDQCGDRLVIHIDKPFGYHTENIALDLATMRSDVYDGLIIGALAIIVVIVTASISFLILYQFTR
ncbi:hypothetical protein TRFO_23973 [Tritrichomonas foetus]|uniref:Right handed beta helix domain-containing protein n=1 Tax=Tritrichomonas foetus TaxID=1144522 RepID=A0A1J4KE23_9EUKA|nr:hypothetical protein TRFO_23973 [Tritrichomonas foetus]|eukprot:OHT07709.1 hypothetical protein TRFO_23973 [Tritrichomonas foetus]